MKRSGDDRLETGALNPEKETLMRYGGPKLAAKKFFKSVLPGKTQKSASPEGVAPECFLRRFSYLNMGNNASQLEKELGVEQIPVNERYYGLVNFGNTCYCNSVLQALYFCRPFRDRVLQYRVQNKRSKENLLGCLSDLYFNIVSQKKKLGTIAPKKFIARLRKENESFDNFMQQDAHEFLNYLLNYIGDLLQAERQASTAPLVNGSAVNNRIGAGLGASSTDTRNGYLHNDKTEPTWIHEIFQGTLTNETKCLNCETVSSKDEDFLDLSVDIDQHTSLSACLRGFSSTETLSAEHKYFCETCSAKQEATKCMRLKRLPRILAIHLKRFKYVDQLNRYTKLSYRVVFPLELRLFNTSSDCMNPEKLYDLAAVVVHCGSGPNRGHYISIVKTSNNVWLLFDDDVVERIEASAVEDFYGLTSDLQKNSETGYILFYQTRE
ncbi:ubiquitin carboxyl-terminal hydrolase 46-like [Paramacrobiotus metropolitanus]|uniref:ubiquitin carboxyl-terminal hydrolase 46-like n=1 Tax=Paramacrobiotus metropolitanus TaxID=2943436 RepID=UPI00244606DA|nr:ubiquitin carboxyl-terminal hydrolase 46-like [Paramacrobiotus metropolitanus]